MLDLFRRGVKTWVAKVLLAILILSFAVWGIGDIFLGTGYSTVARVGETEVSSDRYASTVRREQLRMTMQRREAVSLAEFRADQMDRRVLAAMLREAAYREELARLGIRISRQSVADTIRSNPDFMNANGQFDLGIYNQRIGQSGFRSDEFEQVTEGVLYGAILGEAVRVGQPPEGIARTIAAWQGELRGFNAVVLRPDMAPEPPAPEEAALTAYFEENKEAFRVPERRWGSYIHLSPTDIAGTITPTDPEIEAEYKSRIADYTVEPKRTVEQIVFEDKAKAEAAAQRIADGDATYEEIAAEQNISVADLSLGEVAKSELPDAIDAAIFAADETGVVGPVEGPFGFALLNLTKVVQEEISPLADVRSEVADVIARRQATAIVRGRSARFDELRAGGATMEELAKALETDLVRFDGLAANGTVIEGDAPPLVNDPRFSAEVQAALAGDERDVIALDDGGYVLVMIDKVEESRLPEFDAVRDAVLEAWKAAERMKWLDARAEELVAAAREGTLTVEPTDPDASSVDETKANDAPAPADDDGATADATDKDPDAARENDTGASNPAAPNADADKSPAPTSGIEAIAAKLDQELIELPLVPRDRVPPLIAPEMASRAFAAEEGALLSARSRGDFSVVILGVREIKPLEGEALNERTDAIEGALSFGIAADTQEMFGRALEESHDVEVNEAAINSVFERLGQSGY